MNSVDKSSFYKRIFQVGTMDEAGALPRGPPMNILPPTPPGLETLYTLCRKIYPDQVNPLQVTALLKYWYVRYYVLYD